MNAGEDPYAEHKKITFEQAEGAEPLPSQLKLKEISRQLRASRWNVIHTHLEDARNTRERGSPYFSPPWEGILRYIHIHRDHGMVDEFENDARKLTSKVKQILKKATTSQYLDGSRRYCV